MHHLLVISLLFAFSHNGSDSGLDCAVAHTGVANHDAIAAAKGAVAGLTTGASATYAPHNIRINCIAPGLVSMATWHTQARQGDEVVKTCACADAPCMFIYMFFQHSPKTECVAAIIFMLSPPVLGYTTMQDSSTS